MSSIIEEPLTSGSSSVDHSPSKTEADNSRGGFIELEANSSTGGSSSEEEGVGWESELCEDDREDQELLSELRELYRGLAVNSSIVIDMSSESLNSTCNDDPERLRGKVVQLQRNVGEWKESYDQLMGEFRKLSLEKVVEREELVKEVRILSSNAKDLQQTVRQLESELGEHRNLLKKADSNNQYLLKEVNNLRKERGMREVELNGINHQVNALSKDSKLARLAEEDLGHVIGLIDRGVSDGMLKLSELSLGSQDPPFSCEDLPLGPCACGPLLERYKEDLKETRGELERRVKQLDLVEEKMESLQREHKDTMEELASGRSLLSKTMHERNYLEGELSKRDEKLACLALEVKSLEDDLEISRHKEQSLDDSLNSTSQSLKHVQELTQQHLDIKEQNLSQLKSELVHLEEEKKKLEGGLEESMVSIEKLERAHRQTLEESRQLEEELEERQREKGKVMEIMSGEKDKLQRELNGMVVELECQVKLAEQYKTNVETVQHLHYKCQEEAGRVRAVLLAKEAELSRLLTTLQVTAGQISAMRRRSRESSPRSPRVVSKELSECESAVEEVERELRAHNLHLEALQGTTERDAATIAHLTASKEELEEEMNEREKNIKYLENIVQEVGVNQGRLQETVNDYEDYISHLKEDLATTQLKYQDMMEENNGLKEKLDSLSSLQDQQKLLAMELEKRNEGIVSLQSSQKEMDDLFQECLQRAETAEEEKSLLESEYRRVQEELEEQERTVEALERRVEEERGRGEEEVCALKKQLEEEESRRNEEIARCTAMISSLEIEFQAKTSSLEGALDDQHAQYLEVKRLLEERERAIHHLQEETAFLDKQHQYTNNEVEHSQKLVETLQEDLASSKGRCHGLQQVVSDYELKLGDMAERAHTHKQNEEALQDQVVLVTREAEALQGELEASVSHHSLVLEEEERCHRLQEELAVCQSELSRLNHEGKERDMRCGQQEAEIAKLLLHVAELGRQKQDLDFEVSSYEKTIRSLKSQVSILKDTQQVNQEEKLGLEDNADTLSKKLGLVAEQLEEAKDRLSQQERNRAVLELVRTERLEEIRVLTRELEELRMKGEMAREMEGRVQQLEGELWKKQEEIDRAHGKVIDAEISHEEIHAKLSQFEQCLAEAAEQESHEEELKAVVGDMEKEQDHLREQCFRFEEKVLLLESESRASSEKEHLWKNELSLMSSNMELSQQRVSKLESDLRNKEREMERLEAEVRKSVRLRDLAREEASSGDHFKKTLQQQLAEKREHILELERKLGAQRGDIATLRGKLAASDEGRIYSQQHIHDLEEDNHQLRQSQSETEMDLRAMEHKLEDKKQQTTILREDCTSLADKISTMSEGDRSSNDTLIQKIRYLDSQLASIKASYNDIELKNELLTQSNAELKSHLNALSVPNDTSGNSSGNSLNGGGSLSLSVNVDISNIPPTSSTTTLTTGTSAIGMATATIPIKFDSRYLKAMESGLSTTSLDEAGRYGDSETESEAAALDKEYWIRRSGELSLQLQQSSEYWAQKVRELSIDLEKQKHASPPARHVD